MDSGWASNCCTSESFDANTPFMNLGLDSLDVVQVVSRISKQLPFELSSTVVFEHPTPKDLAHHIHRQSRSTDAHHTGRHHRRPGKQPLNSTTSAPTIRFEINVHH